MTSRSLSFCLLITFLSYCITTKAKNIAKESDLKTLTGKGNTATLKSKTIDGKDINYYVITNTKQTIIGYLFFTSDFAPKVRGFKGPIHMLVKTDQDGNIKDFKVIKSRETKWHMKKILKKKKNFIDHNIFTPDGKKIDTVTGATVSADAMIETLQKSGQNFAQKVLGLKDDSRKASTKKETDSSKVINKIKISKEPPPATVRNIDSDQYKTLIKNKKMSDKKAKFFSKE